MKNLFFILLACFVLISCSKEKTTSTNGKFDPNFTLNVFGEKGFIKNGKMEVEFILSDIEADTPYHFLWDFGDGSENKKTDKKDTKVVHEYTEQGKYHYKVTLVDNDKEKFVVDGDVIVKSNVDISSKSIDTLSTVLDSEAKGKFNIGITNTGTEKASIPFTVKIYFSKDTIIDSSDIVVATKEIASLGIGEIHSSEINFTAPKESGLYYVILKSDATSVYFEDDEANNTILFGQQIEVMGGDSKSADVYVEELKLPNYILKDDKFSVSIKIGNKGKKAAELFTYKLIVSKDNKLDTKDTPEDQKNDELLTFDYLKNALQASESVTVNIDNLRLNDLGSYYFFVVLDPTSDLIELDKDNNIFVSEKKDVTLTVPGIDLAPKYVSVSPLVNISLNKTLSVSYSVKNNGNRPAVNSKVRLFISEDKNLDKNDKLIEFQNPDEMKLGTIGPNSKIDKLHKVKLPESTVTGDNYIIVEVNYDDEVNPRLDEANYDNNTAVSRKINVLPISACLKDIDIKNFNILPNPAFEGSPFTLSFDIGNSGSKEVTSFVSKIFAAPYGVEFTDEHLKKNFNISRLFAGQNANKLFTFELPNSLNNDKYCVKVEADSTGVVLECDEENNTKVMCFPVISRGNDNDIKTSDITISASTVEAKSKVNINFKVSNLGTTNTATFYCQAYLSPDKTLAEDKDYKFSKQKIIYNVPGGESQNITDYEVTVPDNIGNREFNVFVKCDSTNLVIEDNEDNNLEMSNDILKITNSISGCNDDSYENNNTSENSSNMNLENFSAELCKQDIDWYKFENLTINHKFKIEVEPGTLDDFDIEVYKMQNGSLELKSSSTNIRSIEKVELKLINPEDAGTYYLKVFPKDYDSFNGNDYSVRVIYEEVGGPGIDLVLDDVEIATSNIKTNESFNVKFKTENLRSTPSGEYSLSVYVSEDEVISANDVLLYSSNNPSLGLLENKIFNQNIVLGENLDVGEYFIIVKVDPLDSISETNETNNTYTKPILVNYTSDCEYDSLEPNSWDPFKGKIVANGRYENLHVCKNKYDAYILYLKKNTSAKIKLEFIDDDGDIDIHLCKMDDDNCTSSVASSASSSDNEEINYTPTKTGFYKLRVKIGGYGGTGKNKYNMILTGINEGYNLVNDKLEIVSNYLEQNESFYFKYAITSMSTKKINNNINYKLYLSTDTDLDSTDREIYEYTMTNLYPGQIISKQASAILPMNIPTGSYYLISKVDSDDSLAEIDETDNMKSVRSSIKGTCIGDRFEYNNTVEQAEENALITFGKQENLTICPNDYDYYAISLTQGDHIYVNLYFKNLLGDLSLRLIDRDGVTRLADSNTLDDDENLDYTVTNSGIYYIRVRGVGGQVITTSYDLEILKPDCSTLTCANGSCAVSNRGKLFCECNQGFLSDPNDDKLCHDNPCEPNPCQENSTCTVSESFTAVCTCNENHHNDPNNNNVCIEDTRTIDCHNSKVQNSSWKPEYENGKLKQTWIKDSKTWTPADDTNCEWTCNTGYTLQNNDCVAE